MTTCCVCVCAVLCPQIRRQPCGDYSSHGSSSPSAIRAEWHVWLCCSVSTLRSRTLRA